MAGVNNITGLYNSNIKKVSSKLSFDVGESFSARIVKSDTNNKDVIIKLVDGWQFPAELEEPIDFVPSGLLKFQVEGFQEGKLQIKLSNLKEENKESENNSIEDIIIEQKLGSEDSELLEKMVRFGLPLTKENVSRIKTLVGFANKIKEDEGEEEVFIQRYLKSKNLEEGSEKAEQVKTDLKRVFSKIKDLSTEEILTLLENNIDLSEDNIDSFYKVFKERKSIYNTLVSGSNNKEEKNVPKVKIFNSLISKIKENEEEVIIDRYLKNKNIDPNSEKAEEVKAELRSFFSKIKNISTEETLIKFGNDVDIAEEKIESLLKAFDEENNINEQLVNREVNTDKIKSIISFIKKISESKDEEEVFIQKYLKDKSIEPNSNKAEEVKTELRQIFSKINNLSTEELLTKLEKNVDFTEVDINSLYKGLEKEIGIYKDINKHNENELNSVEEDYSSNKLVLNENEKALKLKTISDFINTIRQNEDKEDAFIQRYLKNRNIEPSSENGKEIKADLKVFFSKIKNVSIEGSSSDTNNVSKEEVLNTLEKYIEFNDDNIDSLYNLFKENDTTNNISGKRLEISAKHIENKQTEELFKQEIVLKTEEMKTVIKSLLDAKNNIDSKNYSEVLNGLKEHFNDFKIFNTVSNQYYYMDIPLNIRERNYDFKLILKDDRKSGKKIDSKNIKLVASVDTINLGIVDAYIKAINNSVNVDIKCEESFVKLLDMGKKRLEQELNNIGYNAQIKVGRREKEVNIVSCRDFFGENNLNGINVVV